MINNYFTSICNFLLKKASIKCYSLKRKPNFAVMLKKQILFKVGAAFLFVAFAQLSFASFSMTNKDKNKFSLKNLSFLSKNFSLSALHNKFTFTGSQPFLLKLDENGVEGNSYIHLQQGNTTYVYPYKYVIKMPKFKTPVAPAH